MKTLPKELKMMVHSIIDILGECIQEEYGKSTFQKVEKIRSSFKQVRGKKADDLLSEMRRVHKQVSKEKAEDSLFNLAHSFAVYLELVNQCELAYRSFRIEKSEDQTGSLERNKKTNTRTIFVVTAHPTEARSPDCVRVLNEIRSIIITSFPLGKIIRKDYLKYNIRLLLRSPLAKQTKPTVIDEAEYIYLLILNKDVLKTFADLNYGKEDVFVRSWVGGDKDGHPGVNEEVMIQSLSSSRELIVNNIIDLLSSFLESLNLIESDQANIVAIRQEVDSFCSHLNGMRQVKEGDAKKVVECNKRLDGLLKSLESIKFEDDFYLRQVKSIFYVYPGLCVPLELREDSEIVGEASQEGSQNFAIARMIRRLRDISVSGDPRWYCRALILSMVKSSSDTINGYRLIHLIFNNYALPVVPLLEIRQAIEEGVKIVKEYMGHEDVLKTHKLNFDGRFEVMLGYSDSSKESGSLSSRVLISKALLDLERAIASQGVKPVFFHGSGGSVARGGGSLKEQISWWPKSALVDFKATVQGEMVQRSFSSVQILRRNVDKIYSELDGRNKPGTAQKPTQYLSDFADQVALEYRKLINDEEFLRFVEVVTPYRYLDKLKIGSRPSKRTATLSVDSLRAIPWILCWTQTRLLLVVWWGLGSSWKNLKDVDKKKIKKSFKSEPVFTSYIKQAAFSLAKVDLAVFKFYVESSDLTTREKKMMVERVESEYKLSVKAIREISQQRKLLWHSPWLQESIMLRSTAIYPLNVLQRVALERSSDSMLRETVTGIASGMLTTG